MSEYQWGCYVYLILLIFIIIILYNLLFSYVFGLFTVSKLDVGYWTFLDIKSLWVNFLCQYEAYST